MTQEEFFIRYKYDTDTDLIGSGGFGNVYRAFDNIRNRYVAFKIAQVRPAMEQLSLSKEVELASALPEHQNICHYETCYRFKMPVGTFDYGILQYYPDGNLSQLIRNKKLTADQKEGIAKGIIAGIQHLHSKNIIHRDLKSSNILIAIGYHGEYVPKIADFGLSKQFNDHDQSYFSNSFAGGSLHYVAPEQLEGKDLRKNVDLWGLGVVLYELFMGVTPFKANVDDGSETARAEIIRKIKNASIPSDINKIPEPWRDIIKVCLVANPSKRVKSIEVMGIVSGLQDWQLRESPWLVGKEERIDTLMINQGSNIYRYYDSTKNFSKLNVSELHTFIIKNEASLLIVWVDEGNIYITQNKLDKNKRIVTLAVNQLLGYNEFKKIEEWFRSLNWKIYRTLSIESAIAFSIKDIEQENKYLFSIAYSNGKRDVLVDVGDGVILMIKPFIDDSKKIRTNFNHKNTELWVSLALKGLQNQYEVLIGARKNLLMLDYFGFDIKLAQIKIVNYECTIPSIMTKSLFKKPNNVKDIIEISIGGINGTDDTILLLDCKKYWKKITYDDAVIKDNYFFICNSQGQYLTSYPFFYDEKSEDNEYYLFKEFSRSYIPRDWLRLVDINGKLIDKGSNVMFVDIKIDIDINKTIKIKNNI